MNERPNLRALIQTAQSNAPQQTDIEDVAGKPVQSPFVVNQTEAEMRKNYQMPKASRRKVAQQPATSTRGKSSNPDYEPVKVLVKADLRIKASRKWEDVNGRTKDFSDLIEQLLAEYIRA